MSLQVLILGGSQYLSRNIAKAYIQQNARVDVLTRGRLKLNYHGLRHQLIANRQDGNAMSAILNNRYYDLVIDCSCYQAQDINNIAPFLQQLTGKYILISSGAVYLAANQPVTESHSRGLHPDWGNYGLDKLQAEELLISLDLRRFNIIRPSYIYGKDNNLHREAFIFQRLHLGLDIAIPYQAQTVLNQFIYIDDLINIIVQIGSDNLCDGEAFNASYPENLTWAAYVDCCAQTLKLKANLKPVNYQQLGLRPRQFFPFRDINYQLDSAKLDRFGLAPAQTNLAAGLAAAFIYQQQNQTNSADAGMDKLRWLEQQP